MNRAVLLLTTFCAVHGFTATMFNARPAFLSHVMRTPLYSTPEDGEGGGLDLDLGEMFEMFDAADKEEDFDEAVKKVKGEKAEEK